MNILEQISAEISKGLSSIPRLNNGGCGIVAATLAKELKDLPDMTVHIVSVGDQQSSRCNLSSQDLLNELRSSGQDVTLHSLNSHGYFIDHMYVNITSKNYSCYIDSNRIIIKKTKKNSYFGATYNNITNNINFRFSLDEAETLANNVDGWNPWFDRSQHEENVKLTIKKVVSKVMKVNNLK